MNPNVLKFRSRFGYHPVFTFIPLISLQSRVKLSIVTKICFFFLLYLTVERIIQSKTLHIKSIVYFCLQYIRRRRILKYIKISFGLSRVDLIWIENQLGLSPVVFPLIKECSPKNDIMIKGGSRHKNWCMARVLSFLIRYFSNYYTLHRSDLAAWAAPLDPRLMIQA